jgi:hypothetical protein
MLPEPLACASPGDPKTGVSAMPTHAAGRLAVVAGIAAVLLLAVMQFVPSNAQVLVAVLSLPIVATLTASVAAPSRRRAR